jgi:hypothetical protein
MITELPSSPPASGFLAHPVVPTPTEAQVRQLIALHGADRARDLCMEIEAKRLEAIEAMETDAFHYGYRPDVWQLADSQWAVASELLILGGNRASKTEYAARAVVEALVAKPDARAWCFQTTNQNSISMQQPVVHKYIPQEWRNIKKGRIQNVSYTQKNGFSDNTFVLPNGSQCWFMNYEQDVSVIEGGELDIVWCDELVPLNWLDTLRFRLVTRKGRLLVTFTPIEGWSPTVREYLDGARTIEEAPAPLLPILRNGPDGQPQISGYENVPRVQIPARVPDARVIYFHSSDNPFGGYEEICNKLAGAKRERILERAYGVPTKAMQARFPKFRDQIHIVPAARVPIEGTRYQFIDPCGGRNWFMHWYLVDNIGRIWLYREWPCSSIYIDGEGYPGPWAEPDGKKPDGKRAGGQAGFGWGLLRYKEEIERLESAGIGTPWEGEPEAVFERWMDSRYGNAASASGNREQSTTLIEECADIDLHFNATPGDKSIDEGVTLVNNLFAYNADLPLGVLNEPRLYIAETCANTIYAIKTWTGQDGRHGATKDPIDLLRYMADVRIEFTEDGRLEGARHPGF